MPIPNEVMKAENGLSLPVEPPVISFKSFISMILGRSVFTNYSLLFSMLLEIQKTSLVLWFRESSLLRLRL